MKPYDTLLLEASITTSLSLGICNLISSESRAKTRAESRLSSRNFSKNKVQRFRSREAQAGNLNPKHYQKIMQGEAKENVPLGASTVGRPSTSTGFSSVPAIRKLFLICVHVAYDRKPSFGNQEPDKVMELGSNPKAKPSSLKSILPSGVEKTRRVPTVFDLKKIPSMWGVITSCVPSEAPSRRKIHCPREGCRYERQRQHKSSDRGDSATRKKAVQKTVNESKYFQNLISKSSRNEA